MPITDADLLTGAREALEVKFEFKGQTIVLLPATGVATQTVRGTHAFSAAVARAPQEFALDEASDFDGREQSNRDEGLARKRAYTLVGRFDAVVAIGDTWEDSLAKYTVGTVDRSSGYKTECRVTAYLKEVGHGPR